METLADYAAQYIMEKNYSEANDWKEQISCDGEEWSDDDYWLDARGVSAPLLAAAHY